MTNETSPGDRRARGTAQQHLRVDDALDDARAAVESFVAELQSGLDGHDAEVEDRRRTSDRRRRRGPALTRNRLVAIDRGVLVLGLYDIHGNVEALEAVLCDPAAAVVDAVVVGGDAVPGAFSRAVLDRLEGLDVPTTWVRGNGEREVAAAIGAADPDPEDGPAVTAAVTLAELGTDRARPLGDLPTTVELDGVLYCHATPRSDEELLTRSSAASRYEAALAGVRSALVVAGHTHQQHDVQVGAVRFVNAGSVGLPYEGDGAARWILVDDGVPVLRSTTYDARGAGERILSAGWPDEQSTAASLTDPVAAEVITEVFESRVDA